MGLPADWSFMDQKTHFLFVLEGPEIILLTISVPAQIKHPLPLLRTPFSSSFPFLLVHVVQVKNNKTPTLYQRVSHLREQTGYFAFSWLRCNTGLAWTLTQFKEVAASTLGLLYPHSRFFAPLLSPKDTMFKTTSEWCSAATTIPRAASSTAGVDPLWVLHSVGPEQLEKGLQPFHHLSSSDCHSCIDFTNISRPRHGDSEMWQWPVTTFLWPTKVSDTAPRSGKGCRREGRNPSVFSDTPQDGGFSNLRRQKPSAFTTRPWLPPWMMPEGHPVATSQRVTGDDSL